MNTDKVGKAGRTVAFFGGSFDPPHAGHVAVVKWLLEQDDVDTVMVVPCLAHAFDKRMATFEYRLAMCRLAFCPLGDRVVVSDIEGTLPRPSFTIDTLRAIKAASPSSNLRLVIGSDIPAETSKWKDFDSVRELAPPIFVNRGGLVIQPGAPVFPRVSSTNVRRRLAAGVVTDGLVGPDVAEFIRREDLYGPTCADTSIVICGCGRVGTSLALSFHGRGLAVTVIDREDVIRSRTNLPEQVVRHASVADAVPPGRAAWFVCTGDHAVAGALAEIDLVADPELDCCSVTSATASIRNRTNLPVGRAHPLRAFPPADHASPLPVGCQFAIQSVSRPVMDALCVIGATSFELAPDLLATYHAAAVLASNLPGALAWKASAMFRSCGVPNPDAASLDLMNSMLQNLMANGLFGISGPAARGDAQAVAADQAATDAFDADAGRVHRILADMISRDIFGHPKPDTDSTEN